MSRLCRRCEMTARRRLGVSRDKAANEWSDAPEVSPKADNSFASSAVKTYLGIGTLLWRSHRTFAYRSHADCQCEQAEVAALPCVALVRLFRSWSAVPCMGIWFGLPE